MSTCPKCGHTTPSHDAKLRSLFAGRVGMPAKINRRSPAAARNEMATDIVAMAIDGDARAIQAVVRHAEDCIDPHAAPPIVLGPGGDYLTRVELPRVDSTGMKSWFKDVARALGYRADGGGQ